MESFTFIKVTYVPRPRNVQADALARLASALTLSYEKDANIHVKQRLALPQSSRLFLVEWKSPICYPPKLKLSTGGSPSLNTSSTAGYPKTLPRELSLKEDQGSIFTTTIPCIIARTIKLGFGAFRWRKQKQVMQEIHSGICGGHQACPKWLGDFDNWVIIDPPSSRTTGTGRRSVINARFTATFYQGLKCWSARLAHRRVVSVGYQHTAR